MTVGAGPPQPLPPERIALSRHDMQPSPPNTLEGSGGDGVGTACGELRAVTVLPGGGRQGVVAQVSDWPIVRFRFHRSKCRQTCADLLYCVNPLS